MKNLPFVIWLVCFPVVSEICRFLDYQQENKYSEMTKFMSAMVQLLIWFFVGWLIYER